MGEILHFLSKNDSRPQKRTIYEHVAEENEIICWCRRHIKEPEPKEKKKVSKK
jgi:hypothetical protein